MAVWLSCRWRGECHVSAEPWDLECQSWDLLFPGPKGHNLKDRENMARRGHPLCHWRKLHRSVAQMRPALGLGVRSPWVDIVFPGRTWWDWAAVGSQQSYLLTLPPANRVSCTRYRETAVSVGVMPSKVAPWSPRLHVGVIYDPGLEG